MKLFRVIGSAVLLLSSATALSAQPTFRAGVDVVTVDVSGHRVGGKEKNHGLLVLVNPEIEPGGEVVDGEEGCLSVPGFSVVVPRASRIVVRGWGVSWERVELRAEGLLARVIQHEVDHLDGRLICDRKGALTSGRFRSGSGSRP